MRVLAMRVMMTSIGDKLVRAVLQHQIEEGDIADGTYRCVWEDVRELPITSDGKVVLSTVEPEMAEVPQVFLDAFRDEELRP